MNGDADFLTVFFPMWNEEAMAATTVEAAHTVCGRLVSEGELVDYEILLIDDGSTDRTATIVDDLAAADPHVRVVHHENNRGLGAGIKTGFHEARGNVVLYTDADLPADLAEVRKALRLLRIYDADIVSAYRHDRTGEGTKRVVYSFAYNWLVRLAFGLQVRDVNFAFKLCRREVLDRVNLESEGSFIDAELLIRAQKAGFEIIQFGVDYFPRTRGESSLASGSTILKILREMRFLASDLRN
ncbi:MAG TPA: glycosyltransferase family 2 protein [Acidimicrobiales bacterium]|nr:glycosyltransferase family 2 protein [Acidimicrobiales bacterium]